MHRQLYVLYHCIYVIVLLWQPSLYLIHMFFKNNYENILMSNFNLLLYFLFRMCQIQAAWKHVQTKLFLGKHAPTPPSHA